MFLLVNLTKVSTAAHSMYFPESQFQLGSPLILVTAPELTASFTPTSKVSWKVEAFSLCMVFTSPRLSREVPHGTKGTGPGFVTRPVYLRSQLRNNRNTVSVLVLLMYLFHTLYTRYAGIAHHWALQTSGQGWAVSKAVHGMECGGGTLALLEIPLSRGCCLKGTVLPVQEGVLTNMTEC